MSEISHEIKVDVLMMCCQMRFAHWSMRVENSFSAAINFRAIPTGSSADGKGLSKDSGG